MALPALLPILKAFLISQAAKKVATEVTDDPKVGQIAGTVAGGISGGSSFKDIAVSSAKEAAIDKLAEQGEGGQLLASGLNARSAFRSFDNASQVDTKLPIAADTTLPAINRTNEPSAFSKALPAAALAIPAILSLAETGKITPGLKAGTSLLQGISSIQGLQESEAQEKDRATKAGIEIEEMKKKQQFLDTKMNPELDPIFGRAEPGQKDMLNNLLAPHRDENGRITNRVAGQLKKTLLSDSKALDAYLKIGSQAKDQRAAKLFEEAENIRTKEGETDKYRAKITEYQSAVKIANAYATSGDELRQAAVAKENQDIELAGKFTPESIEAFKAGTGNLVNLPKEKVDKDKGFTTEEKRRLDALKTQFNIQLNELQLRFDDGSLSPDEFTGARQALIKSFRAESEKLTDVDVTPDKGKDKGKKSTFTIIKKTQR